MTAVMLTALATTKTPILIDERSWIMAHEACTDFAMLLGSLFLIAVGAGPASFDTLIVARGDR